MADIRVEEGILACKAEQAVKFWFHVRCGRDPDCIPGDGQEPFYSGYCNAINWTRKNFGSGRFAEVWDPENRRMLFKITERNATLAKWNRCQEKFQGKIPFSFTYGDDPNPYTVQIPGIADILRVPGIDTAAMRRERAARMARARTSLPEPLAWVPKLLNKLDDAQDLLYTALVAGVAITKFAGVRMIPGLGILLGINDVLNALT